MVRTRKYSYTKAKRERYLKEMRGQGNGANYKPWIQIQNLPSQGRSSRVLSIKTGRSHHLFSDLEANYFYLFDWQEKVIDIREQYPLQREITLDIARRNVIKHQQDPITKEFIDLTTDFLLTLVDRDGNHIYSAITVKYSKDLENERVLEKFEIERRYWELKNIEWRIVTEHDLPKILVKNIQWCRSFMDEKSIEVDQEQLSALIQCFLTEKMPLSLVTVSNKQDRQFGLEQGTTLKLIRYLLGTKRIYIKKHCCWMTEATVLDVIFKENYVSQ